MNAEPFLTEVARALKVTGLHAVLIGNAAAALHGAPVTTLDFDFLFRRTPVNLRKLKRLSAELRAVVLRPYYPVSDLFRVTRDDGLQVDFMGSVHGLRSFEGVTARAVTMDVGGHALRVASLADVIKSKRAAGRARDIAVLEVLERTHAVASETSPHEPSRPPRRPGARKRARAR